MPETAASSSAQGTDVSGSQTPGLDTPNWRDEFKVWSVAADELIEGVFASGKLVGACETGGLAAGVVAEGWVEGKRGCLDPRWALGMVAEFIVADDEPREPEEWDMPASAVPTRVKLVAASTPIASSVGPA